MVPSHSMGPSLLGCSCRTKSTSLARRLQSCFCQSYSSSQTQLVITGVMWNSPHLPKDTCESELQLRARQWCKLSQSPAAKVAFHVSRSKLSHATRRIPTALSLASIRKRGCLVGFLPTPRSLASPQTGNGQPSHAESQRQNLRQAW